LAPGANVIKQIPRQFTAILDLKTLVFLQHSIYPGMAVIYYDILTIKSRVKNTTYFYNIGPWSCCYNGVVLPSNNLALTRNLWPN
jgi:hypothetical protein